MPDIDAEKVHKPVLLSETLGLLEPERGGLFVDATLGLGGHGEAILAGSPETQLIGIDQDARALKAAGERLAKFGQRATLVHSNFSAIREVVDKREVDGILADLGVSSLQLDSETRGFSFRFDAPLDMRMDPDSGDETVAELLKRLSQDEIANIIYQYGEERHSRRIARRIIERRERGEPVETTFEKRAIERVVSTT